MSQTGVQGAFREASLEMHRYFSGELAPMMVTDTLETLAGQPPELTAKLIADWVHGQLHGPDTMAVADLVYHALKKLHLLAEFDLVAHEPLMRFLQSLARILVQLCPEEERDTLRLKVSRLGDVEAAATTSRVEYLHRAPGSEPVTPRTTAPRPPAAADAAVERGMRKLSLLLERLGNVPAPTEAAAARADVAAGSAPPVDPTVLSQVLATAALEARSNADLDLYLGRVRQQGLAAPMAEVFRNLGNSLPGWMLPAAAPAQRPLEAMTRLVSLAPDAAEGTKRLGEMIYTAIEQFNEGRLPQAAAILDAASRLIADKRTDASMVQNVVGQAQGSISDAALKRSADSSERHALLRKVIEFFPAYRPKGILDALMDEPRRDRRKLLLALFECYGEAGREPLLERMVLHEGGTIPDEHGWHKRNLIFLLRRLPQSDEAATQEVLRHLRGALASGETVMVVKEAIGALGQFRHRDAESALMGYLRSLEADLASRATPATEGSWDLLDRTCAALARQGTPDAIRTVVAHAFSGASEYGDTGARLDHLAWQDLSVDAEQLGLLLEAIRTRLPGRVLGFVRKPPTEELLHLVRAVSGTPTSEVRAALDEVVKRFEGKDLGQEAARARAKLEPKARTPAASEALSGDLELFAFPNLLQSLADSHATGELALFDRSQAKQASIQFLHGRLSRMEAGRISGLDALYHLLEKPFPGTFVFRARSAGPAKEGEGNEVLGVLLEGLRRNDEYQQARAMVPDGAAFEADTAKPTPPEEEADADLLRRVWEQASKGTPADLCEASTATDAYRIRRMYAHWLEEKALRPKAPR